MKAFTVSLWRRFNTCCLPRRLRRLGLWACRGRLSDFLVVLFCLMALSTFVILATSLSPVKMTSYGLPWTRNYAMSREEALLKRWVTNKEFLHKKLWGDSDTVWQAESFPKRIEAYIKNGTFRPSTCNNCSQFVETFLVHPSACSGEATPANQALQLLVLVSSAPHDYEKRMAVRQTWGSVALTQESGVQLAFVVGQSSEEKDDERVQEESEVHGDLLIVDYVDTYDNLTIKTMAGLRWASEYCPQARFVLKCDDDVWLNTLQMAGKLHDVLEEEPVLAGYCVQGMPPNRDPNSKWYTSFRSHPSGKYPSFCFGPGYLLSQSAVAGVLRASPNVPFFHLEDVYTAMCAHQALVSVRRVDGFFNRPLESDACTHRSSRVLLAHDYSPQRLRDIWAAKCYKLIVPELPPPMPAASRHRILRQRALKNNMLHAPAKVRPVLIKGRRRFRGGRLHQRA